jgi:peptide chain release factor 1
MEKVQELEKRYQEIINALKKAERVSDWKKVGELAKRKEEIEKILKKKKELKEIKNKISQAEQILKTEKNRELLLLAQKEKEELQQRSEKLEKEIKSLLREKDREKPESVIVEIRAGAGGEEAALFANDLFNMYLKYANLKGWNLKILESRRTDLGGIKEIIFEVKGVGAYSKLKYEGGVHRVQRIPETEKAGRIHTSTASVVILKKPREAQIKIRPEDLRIETFRASGPGGQYVNRRESAVRITHIPTGIVVSCQNERTQAQNRENALSILEARLLKLKEESQSKEIQEKRRAQIGRMERAEKIRTYNFPQNRVTDHRIKKTWYNIEEILSGKLDPIIEELEKQLS